MTELHYLELTELSRRLHSGEISPVEATRAQLARIVLMLLDEPSEGVQPSIAQMICAALQSFCREIGTTILLVEQNLDTILAISRRCYVMEKGRIVAGIEPGCVTAEAVRGYLMI